MARYAPLLLRSLAALAVLAFSAAPLLAQPADRPGWDHYGPMWGGWGWHPGMIFGGVIMLLFLVAIVLLIIWLVRGITQHHGPGSGYWSQHRSTALDILAERFARGEIDKNEFEEKRRLIGR